jgi:hypothetical protein
MSARRERRVDEAHDSLPSAGNTRGLLLSLSVLCAGAAVATWVIWKNRHFFHDDCYIALRYVRNLLQGHGLVWNPGERVEGYSSFAHVLGISGLGAAGMPLPLAARVLNALGLLLSTTVVCVFALRRGLPLPLSASLGALVLGFVPMGVWVMGGLEAPLYAGVLALGVASMASRLECTRPDPPRDALAAACLGAVALMRPDGAWFGAAAALLYAVRFLGRGRDGVLGFLAFAAAGLALPAAHLLFRLSYYGEWLPNSVIAKVVGVPSDPRVLEGGFAYLWSFVTTWPVLLALALLLPGFAERRARAPLAFLLLSVSGYAALVVKAGGDHMVDARLLAPLLPVMLLGSAYGLAALRWTRWRHQLLVSAVALAALGLQPLMRSGHKPDTAAYLGESVGRHLARSHPPGTLVAANSAGATAYFAPDLHFVDMLGLNDEHIARRRVEHFQTSWQLLPGHAKGDGAYVLERRPEIIILGPVNGRPADEPWFLSDLELQSHPEFARHYAYQTARLDVRDRAFHRHYGHSRTGALTLHYYQRRPLGSRRERSSQREGPPQNWK